MQGRSAATVADTLTTATGSNVARRDVANVTQGSPATTLMGRLETFPIRRGRRDSANRAWEVYVPCLLAIEVWADPRRERPSHVPLLGLTPEALDGRRTFLVGREEVGGETRRRGEPQDTRRDKGSDPLSPRSARSFGPRFAQLARRQCGCHRRKDPSTIGSRSIALPRSTNPHDPEVSGARSGRRRFLGGGGAPSTLGCRYR